MMEMAEQKEILARRDRAAEIAEALSSAISEIRNNSDENACDNFVPGLEKVRHWYAYQSRAESEKLSLDLVTV